jgi:hypothetical protein
MNITEYKNKVAGLGCMACRLLGYGETPASLHHPREGQGGGQRASDWLVIPLCHEHHQGKNGIHGHGFEALNEMDLLAATIKAVLN